MLATASSFGEFFSIYWEALHNSEFAEGEVDIESLLNALPTVSEVEAIGSGKDWWMSIHGRRLKNSITSQERTS